MKTLNHKTIRRPDMFVKATNVETGDVRYFVNGVDFSEAVGCSKPLPYVALEGRTPTAYGWRLEWVSKDLPECEDFKRKVEDDTARRKREKMDAYNEKRRKESAERRAIRLKRKELRLKEIQKQKELIRQMRENERKQRLERKANEREERLLRRKERAEAMEKARREMWERHIVLQCDLNGNTIAEFRTAYDAEKMIGIRGIGTAIRKGGPWKGYVWKYKVPREYETINLQEEEENNEIAIEVIQ